MTEPLTEHIAHGIHRIPLPLPLDDLKSINSYAIESASGLALVDPGWATADTARVLNDAIEQLGYHLTDVTNIIATHSHWDHYTQAVAIRDQVGAKVHLGSEEKHSLTGFETLDGCYPRQVELLRAAGAAKLAEYIEALPFREHEIGIPLGDPDVWVNDGDVIHLDDRILTVHDMPGHTRGHVIIVDRSAGVMFTGDHILPRITPSIGFERVPEPLPLRSFISSLRTTLELPDAQMLPAHGPLAPSVHARAEELLDHHAERLAVVHDLAADGLSPCEIARSLPWTRYARRLDDLDPVHQMTAILEVAAHLEYADFLKTTHATQSSRS